jgi:hypothetical protein
MPHIVLSDGSRRDLPANLIGQDGTVNHQGVNQFYHDEERKLLAQYSAQAKAQGSPVETGSTIYSQTRAYPNNLTGKVQAWADHHVYPGAGEDIGSAERVGSTIGTYAIPSMIGGPEVGAAMALHDLGVSGYNAVRHGLGYSPEGDWSTFLGAVQKALDVPQPGEDTSPIRSTVETGLELPFVGGKAAGNVLTRAAKYGLEAAGTQAASYEGGNIAAQVFGEPWRETGQVAGGSATGPAVSSVGRGGLFASEQAPEIAAAAERQGITPSFSTLATEEGKRVSKTLKGMPVSGWPIQGAEKQTADQVKAAIDNAAETVAGKPLPYAPGRAGVTDEFIGNNLIQGAREGAKNLRDSLNQEQDAFAQKMSGTNVSITPIIRDMANYINDPDNGVTLEMRNAITARLQNLYNMTTASGNPNYYNVSGADVVPWAVLRNWRGEVNDALRNVAPGQAQPSTRLLGALDDSVTNTMQRSADLVSPGLGNEFRQLSSNYANAKNNILPELDRVGGVPITDRFTGAVNYQGGLDPGPAAREIASASKQQGTQFIDLASNPNYFPSTYWKSAAGGLISQLGEDNAGNFRPDLVSQHWGFTGDAFKDALTTSPGGAPTTIGNDINDIALIGKSTSIPTSRHGLTEQAGASAATVIALEKAAELAAHHLGISSLVGAPLLGYGLSSHLQSPGFLQEMGQGPTSYASEVGSRIYENAPTAATTILGGQGSSNYWQPSPMATPTPTAPTNYDIGAQGPSSANAAPSQAPQTPQAATPFDVNDLVNRFYPALQQ